MNERLQSLISRFLAPPIVVALLIVAGMAWLQVRTTYRGETLICADEFHYHEDQNEGSGFPFTYKVYNAPAHLGESCYEPTKKDGMPYPDFGKPKNMPEGYLSWPKLAANVLVTGILTLVGVGITKLIMKRQN